MCRMQTRRLQVLHAPGFGTLFAGFNGSNKSRSKTYIAVHNVPSSGRLNREIVAAKVAHEGMARLISIGLQVESLSRVVAELLIRLHAMGATLDKGANSNLPVSFCRRLWLRSLKWLNEGERSQWIWGSIMISWMFNRPNREIWEN
jgi:hypothetical protein